MTRRSLVFALATLALATATAAPVQAKNGSLRGKDVLAAAGAPTTIHCIAKGKIWFLAFELTHAKVEFRANGALLGSAMTDSEGDAALTIAAPAAAADVFVTCHLASGGYSASDVTLLMAVRDPGARIVICDVDYTLSQASATDVLFKSNAQLPPVKGAVKGVTDIAKDATVVYVSARIDAFDDKTHAWLDLWHFPRAVYVSATKLDVFVNPRPYKSATIRMLKATFANMPVGFGDLPTDAQAYNDNQLTSYIFLTHNAGPYPPYSILSADWDTLRASNKANQASGLAWATSFR